MANSTLSTIVTPVIPGLIVTPDYYGGGRNDDGVPYATFDISRPDSSRGYGARLASITIYADADIPALVSDRFNGRTAADIKAVQKVRDYLASNHPTARANSYRYVTV